MHRWHRLCAPVFGLLIAATASASEQSLPEACGSRADFERELKLRLGEDAPVSRVRSTITPVESGYHLRVQVGDEVREVDDPSCQELFRASIVIAVAILMHGRDVAKSAPAAPSPSSPPPATEARAEYPRFTLSGGVGANVGTLPNPVLAGELEGQTLWRRWGLALHARYLLSTSTTAVSGAPYLDASAVGIGAAAIFRPARSWQTRLGFAVQRLAGTGRGTHDDRHDHVWAAGPTLGLAWLPLEGGTWWAGVGAEGQLNAVRGQFQILNYPQNSTEPYAIYHVPWLALSTFVRLGLAW